MAPMVSDEVWQLLDPYAGQLGRRTVRRLRVAVAIAVALAVVAGILWWSGLLLPRISWHSGTGWGTSAGPDRVTHEVAIINQGRVAVEVLGIGRSGPGFELVEVQGASVATLRPGEVLQVVLVYRVTDCAAVTADAWPVPVRVRRPWGTYTGYVALPTQTSPAAPAGWRSFTGRDPYEMEWQRALADLSCENR